LPFEGVPLEELDEELDPPDFFFETTTATGMMIKRRTTKTDT